MTTNAYTLYIQFIYIHIERNKRFINVYIRDLKLDVIVKCTM